MADEVRIRDSRLWPSGHNAVEGIRRGSWRAAGETPAPGRDEVRLSRLYQAIQFSASEAKVEKVRHLMREHSYAPSLLEITRKIIEEHLLAV